MSVYLQDGKVLLVDGKVATSEDCCCSNMGACCVGEDCTIETEADCAGMGGTYQGNDTTCDPNPCPSSATGACCTTSGCVIESNEECFNDGGYYFGDDTTCDGIDCFIDPCGFSIVLPGNACLVSTADPFRPGECNNMGSCYACCVASIYESTTEGCIFCVDSPGTALSCGTSVQCFTGGTECIEMTAADCASSFGGASVYCSCPV